MLVTPENWTWDDGIGFLPLGKKIEYGNQYFEHYEQLRGTPQDKLINHIRASMVEGWINKDHSLLDVGVGAGAFVDCMLGRGWNIYGDDVNPRGVLWLKDRERLYQKGMPVDAVTFWDVLEHIPDPDQVLKSYGSPEWIFTSMPIYEDENHVFQSKHFKPGEHCWYFTEDGLIRFMESLGYLCVELNGKESILVGRDSVTSFVFRKI